VKVSVTLGMSGNPVEGIQAKDMSFMAAVQLCYRTPPFIRAGQLALKSPVMYIVLLV
jgi:hypothetical protein